MVGSDPRNSQGMGWITDRLPTEADADGYGYVLVEDGAISGAMPFSWSEVVLGQGWWSPLAADAASALLSSTSTRRKVVQITTPANSALIFAVCDDGTVWLASAEKLRSESAWVQIPGIPGASDEEVVF